MTPFYDDPTKQDIYSYFHSMGFTTKATTTSLSIGYQDDDLQHQELRGIMRPHWYTVIARMYTMYHKDDDSFDYVKIVWKG